MTTVELNDVVADYCNREIEIGRVCPCVTAHGLQEMMLADQYCQICGGTGIPTRETLHAGLGKLGDELDQLAGTAADVCVDAKRFIDMAWYVTEEAIRKLTGSCSRVSDPGKSASCGCCAHFDELKVKAERAARLL